VEVGRPGTFGIAADPVFGRRARNAGPERKRRRHSVGERQPAPFHERRRPGGEFDRCGGEHGPGQHQHAGDRRQALEPWRRSCPVRIDHWRRQRRQCRPARARPGQERTERVRPRLLAERPPRHVGAQPLRPSVQRRVCWRPARVLGVDRVAQAPVAEHVRVAQRRDCIQVVALEGQHVARQHAHPVAALVAARHRERPHQPHEGEHAVLVQHQRHHRSLDPRAGQPKGPKAPHRGQHAAASPFRRSAS